MIEETAAFHNDFVLAVHSFLFCPFLAMFYQVTLYEYLCQMAMEVSINSKLTMTHEPHPVKRGIEITTF